MSKLTNQEAKEKAIREAYGDLWGSVKDHVNKWGWCSLVIGYAHDHNSDIDLTHGAVFKWRPKSLINIAINNGWHRIDGPETLPDTAGTYTVLGKSGKIEAWHYNGNDAFWLEYFTHWRPIKELPLPIY